jgi:arabinose-5-phosphate isomerase
MQTDLLIPEPIISVLQQGDAADDGAGDLAVAAAVLANEANALRALAGSLAGEFVEAVAVLSGISGRVVVTGIGKSGHVARKVAATFASTGTPALFVHPAEASHGDLGMLMAGDAVLALSNSGETAELADIVAHARRFGLKLIAITSTAGSTLARTSDVVLLLPQVAEACPMGLAPTTSTTMQIALGDALAVALLTRRGFTATDFRRFHPGGKLGEAKHGSSRLGAKLRYARELMHTGDALPIGTPDMPMASALLLMNDKRFGCLGIVDADGCLCGIITDGDLRRAMGPDLLSKSAGDIMTASPRTIQVDALAADALREMNARARPITSLFVVEAGVPVGILHIHDVLRAGVA